MTRKLVFSTAGVALAIIASLAAVLTFGGISSAQESESEATEARRPRPTTLAIAIGQLEETGEDEYATVDLHASERGARGFGSLRFFSEEHGYYNGGVRTLACEDGVITAKGGGGLFQPDGTRIGVVYEATFDGNSGESTITVSGRDGFEYTLEGNVEGLIWCGSPSDALPAF